MPVHNFSMDEQFSTMDKVPDHRSEAEKQYTPLAIYNHDKADLGYAERMAEELLNISGAWVTFFPRAPQLAPDDADEVWDEDADPIYLRGLKMKAYFKPDPIMLELTRYGLDIALKVTVVVSRAVLYKELGSRLVAPGDVFRIPYNHIPDHIPAGRLAPQPFTFFRVMNAYDAGMFQYRWLYYHCATELLTGDEAVQPLTRD